MKKFYLTLTGLALLTTLFAQTAQSNFPILFINETVKPHEVENQQAESFSGWEYVIVQHPRLQLKADFHGYHTFSYLPKNSAYAYVQSAEAEMAKQKLRQAGGSVLAIQPEWKLSKKLFAHNYPEWAWVDGDRLKIWLTYYPNLTASTIVNDLASRGQEVIDRKDDENLVAVAIDPEKINQLTALPYVYFVQEMEDPGKPENFKSRNNHRVNMVQVPGQPQLDGSGVKVGHGDDGDIGPHIDFKGRLVQGPNVSNRSPGSDHGDHVAGTIFGAGNRDPEGRGMAPGAEIFYQDYPDNLGDADQNYQNRNVRITSSSYSNGCNAGYTNFTRQMDRDAFQNPEMLHVFSAGNSNNQDCGYGAGNQWGNVTGGHKIAKNVIAVANLTDNDNIASSSSRGPASDGRIKPDIAAVGTNVYSTTTASGPNGYTFKTGTSMSCPGVSGTLALLYQAYKNNNSGNNPNSVLMKSILMNTAEDLGNDGPDFIHGYGRINAARAVEVVNQGDFTHDSLNTGDTLTFKMAVPQNTAQARFMLQWKDEAASTSAARALVNDLDMEVSFDGTTYQPWVLNPTPNANRLNNPAVRARDSLNNIEQVTIDGPVSDTATIRIIGYNLPSGTVDFFVTSFYEKDEIEITFPRANQPLAAGEQETIRWDAPQNSTASFSLEYSTDGSTWNIINGNLNSSLRSWPWNAPNLIDGSVQLRLVRQGDTSVSEEFPVISTPENLELASSCPDSLTIAWDSVAQADGYVVYRLGAKYMDSLTFVSNESITLAHDLKEDDWFSVAAVKDGSIGRRAVAIQRAPFFVECDLRNDLVIDGSLPASGAISNCYDVSDVEIGLRLFNDGRDTVFNFNAGFNLNSNQYYVQSFTDTIPPNRFAKVYFDSTLTLNGFTPNQIDFYIEDQLDQNPYNDSATKTLRVYNGQTVKAPHTQNFEQMAPCGTSRDCGGTVCFLNQGWYNAVNGEADIHDWRVNSGSTDSRGTGPFRDDNPGSASGNYIYLEASGGCDSAQAVLLSPCLNLEEALSPKAYFSYHMLGSNMGKLNVDVYDGENWHLNVIPTISGNQGSAWNTASIDLWDYRGETVQIRFRGKTGDGFQSDLSLDNFRFVDSGSVGLNERALGQNLRLFPNPSTGVFNLEFRAQGPENLEVQIRDLRGRLIETLEFESRAGINRREIDLSSSPKGVYLLELTGENSKITEKVVIE